MKSWRAVRAHQSARRRIAQEVGDLTRAVIDARSARTLARIVLSDIRTQPHPTTHDVVVAVATRCSDDGQRSGLAAYLHVCRDVSFATLAEMFDISPAAARRLVERGTGTTPITAADDCRGWALVAPRPGRTEPERRAASGHLSLCRRCRYRLRAHAVLEHRVAAAGSAAFGASVTAAVARTFAGGNLGGAAGAITGPVMALSTAAALTAGVGAFAVTTHHEGTTRPAVTNVSHEGPAPAGNAPATEPSASTPANRSADNGGAAAPSPAQTPVPGVAPSRLAPLPGSNLLKLPQVSPPALPLPTVSVQPVPLPTSSLPVPVPTLTLPPLP
jgi:hypothetical protein